MVRLDLEARYGGLTGFLGSFIMDQSHPEKKYATIAITHPVSDHRTYFQELTFKTCNKHFVKKEFL